METIHVKKHLMLLIMVLGIACIAKSQQITGYRYWFDGDLSSAVTVTVDATTNLDLNATLSAGSFAIGYHTISLQFIDDNGSYSVPITKRFVSSGHYIVAYRYWFDGDMSSAVTVDVSPTNDLDLNTALSTGSLVNGYHTLSVQFMDDNGGYSVPVTKRFISSGSDIAAYDYWWDGNYAGHTMVNVTPAQSVDLMASIVPYNLPIGQHLFAIRFEDQQGNWSVPVQDTVQTTVYFNGIRELSSVQNITISPNPASSSAMLTFDGSGNEILTLTVSDMAGNQLQHQNLQNGFRHEQYRINTADLTPGVYLVKISSGKGSATRKLIVQ